MKIPLLIGAFLGTFLVATSLFGQSFTCPDSSWTPTSFTLVPPTETDKDHLVGESWSPSIRLRIDICWQETDGIAFVNQIIWKDNQEELTFVGESSHSQSLYDALFGDTGQVDLILNSASTRAKKLTLNGIPSATPLLALTIQFQNQSQTYTGRFEMGDPFTMNDCLPNEQKDVKTYQLDQATLEATRCVQPTGSGTDLIRLLAVSYRDASPHLTDEEQKPIAISGDSLNKVARYTTTHHNCNDSLEVHLPFVDWSVQFDVYQQHIQMISRYQGKAPVTKVIPWSNVPPQCGIYNPAGQSGPLKPLVRSSGQKNPYQATINGIIVQFDAAVVNATYKSGGHSVTRTFWIYRTYTMSDQVDLGKLMTTHGQQVVDANLLGAIRDGLLRSPFGTKQTAIDNLNYQLQ